jgi:hypothetical protein
VHIDGHRPDSGAQADPARHAPPTCGEAFPRTLSGPNPGSNPDSGAADDTQTLGTGGVSPGGPARHARPRAASGHAAEPTPSRAAQARRAAAVGQACGPKQPAACDACSQDAIEHASRDAEPAHGEAFARAKREASAEYAGSFVAPRDASAQAGAS